MSSDPKTKAPEAAMPEKDMEMEMEMDELDQVAGGRMAIATKLKKPVGRSVVADPCDGGE